MWSVEKNTHLGLGEVGFTHLLSNGHYKHSGYWIQLPTTSGTTLLLSMFSRTLVLLKFFLKRLGIYHVLANAGGSGVCEPVLLFGFIFF